MANKLYNETDVENIAEAIREPLGSSATYKISEMASGINSLADTLKSYIPHTQASGNPINIDNVIPLKPKVLDVVGDTKQDTTSGKNLLDENIITETSKNGLNIKFINGKVKIVGTATANTNISFNYTFPQELLNQSVTLSISKVITSIRNFGFKKTGMDIFTVTTYNGITFNTKTITQEDINNINQIDFYILNGSQINEEFNIQLEEGSTATSYEPYTGGIASPNPDYPQSIRNVKSTSGVLEYRKTGKNLLKLGTGSSSRNNTTISVNNDVINLKNTGTTNYVAYGIDNELRQANYGDYVSWGNQILRAGTYTLSCKYISGSTTTTTDSGNMLNVTIYGRNIEDTDRVKTNLARVYVKTSSTSVTFTIAEDMEINVVTYLYAANATVDINFQVQLEQGSTATSYEAYKSSTVPFNIGSTEFCKLPNGTADKLWVNLRTGEYGKTQNVGKVVLDGSENWGYQNDCFAYNGINDIKPTPNYADRGQIILMSNYYITQLSDYRGTLQDLHIIKVIDPNASKQIAIKYLAMNGIINDFKSWLSTHNTEVQYELATPVTTTLGTLSKENLAKLAMYEDVNNLELSGYDDNGAEPIIEIDYYTSQCSSSTEEYDTASHEVFMVQKGGN